jgi:hypothetical protein
MRINLVSSVPFLEPTAQINNVGVAFIRQTHPPAPLDANWTKLQTKVPLKVNKKSHI